MMPRAKKLKKPAAYAESALTVHSDGLSAEEAAAVLGIPSRRLRMQWFRLGLSAKDNPPAPRVKSAAQTERDQAIIALHQTGMGYTAIGRRFKNLKGTGFLSGTRIKQIIERRR